MRSLVRSHRSKEDIMAIFLMRRTVSLHKLKGNPKVGEALYCWNRNKIDPKVENNPLLKNISKDFKSYITFLYENAPEEKIAVGNRPMYLSSYREVIEQFENGKTPSKFRSIKEKRVILGWIEGDSDGMTFEILAYYPEQNVLKITREPGRINVLGRLTNKINNTILNSDNTKTVIPVSDIFDIILGNL